MNKAWPTGDIIKGLNNQQQQSSQKERVRHRQKRHSPNEFVKVPSKRAVSSRLRTA